jgi:hypothetical protein
LFALTLRYEILKPWEAGLMFLLEVKTKASLLAQPESLYQFKINHQLRL